jgi:hypothetical protein
MAANDELARLRAENEELRDKVDELQEVNRGLQGRRSPSPSPSSSDDDSSLSSSSSDGASRKRRRGRKKTKSRRKSRRCRRSRSMSAASLAEANARDVCNEEADAYFDTIRTGHARYMAAVALARQRKTVRQLEREQDRALSRIEFAECCPTCHYSPCRCVRGHHRCPEANRDEEAARISAEAEVLEAQLRKQRAADALSDYLASRPKRARVEEIEDAAAPEPKRVRASD